MNDWDQIVREHGPAVFATAWRILGHADDTRDVVQEVFLQALQMQQRQQIRCESALFRRLAVCRAVDHVRQRRPTVPIHGLAILSTSSDPEGIAIEKELAERLRQAIGYLPRREATVFCLRYFDDRSNEEIAQTLQIRPGAVSTALQKARARLESLLCLREMPPTRLLGDERIVG